MDYRKYFIGAVFTFSHLIISAQASAAVCIDTDGDGWGWDGEKSCVVMQSAGQCIDTDGDGWGWDGVKSCRVPDVVSMVGPCTDTDGDGWGWNGVGSCVPGETPTPTPTPQPPVEIPTCMSAASDPDGDGWGWENGASCVVSVLPPQPPGPVCTALKQVVATGLTPGISRDNRTIITNDGTIYLEQGNKREIFRVRTNSETGEQVGGLESVYQGSGIFLLAVSPQYIYFIAQDDASGDKAVFRTALDGSDPIMLSGTLDQNVASAGVALDGSFYYFTNTDTKQLWAYDASTGGSAMLADYGRVANSDFNNLVTDGSNLYFHDQSSVYIYNPASKETLAVTSEERTFALSRMEVQNDVVSIHRNNGGVQIVGADGTLSQVSGATPQRVIVNNILYSVKGDSIYKDGSVSVASASTNLHQLTSGDGDLYAIAKENNTSKAVLVKIDPNTGAIDENIASVVPMLDTLTARTGVKTQNDVLYFFVWESSTDRSLWSYDTTCD